MKTPQPGFVGYTPQLATAVAVYSEDQAVPLRGLFGLREISGGSLPARAWSRFTTAAMQGQPVQAFAEPARVGTGPPPTPAPTTYPTLSPRPEDDATPRELALPPRPAGELTPRPLPSPTPAGGHG